MSSAKSLLALMGVLLAIAAITRPNIELPPAAAEPTVQNEPPTQMPRISARAASNDQIQRLGEALTSFSEAGLDLPDLEITFFDSPERCDGDRGRFDTNEIPWHISVCATETVWVVEHELAHAWVEANVTPDQRKEFLDLGGFDNWFDHDVPWNQRGGEWAAVIVQQGVSGLPLPPALSEEARSRLTAFELLTDRPAPKLVEWIQERDVACENRPTTLSRPLEDATGRSCTD